MTNGRLFGEKKPKPETPDPYPGETKRLIALYCELYAAEYNGERPVVEGKAAAQLKNLVRDQSPTKVEERLRFFMRWKEPFVVDAGHSLTVFPSQWNKITALLQKQKVVGNLADCKHLPRCLTAGVHSRKVVDEMKAAVGHRTTEPRPSPTASSPTTSKRSEPC